MRDEPAMITGRKCSTFEPQRGIVTQEDGAYELKIRGIWFLTHMEKKNYKGLNALLDTWLYGKPAATKLPR